MADPKAPAPDKIQRLKSELDALLESRHLLRNEINIEAENLAIMRANLRCFNDEIREARKAISNHRKTKEKRQ